MTFWGVEVKPGKPFVLECGELGGSLILTQATLGIGKSSKRSILQVNVGDNKPIFVCSLLPDISECFTLNLEFDEEEDVKFSVVGPTSIHLSGYVDRPKHDDEDCELDCCGEDIAETESEHSEFEDEDEDEDDFIDDEDMPMHPPSPAQHRGVIEKLENEEKPGSEKGGNKKSKKKKKKELDNDMDHERKIHKQIDAKGKTSASELESEDEDGFPLSLSANTLNGESRFAKLQTNTGSKIADKFNTTETINDAKENGEPASNLKRKVDAMDHDQEPKSDGIDAINGDVSVENKKKKSKKNKKKAKTETDEMVASIKQNGGEVANVKQDGDKEVKKMPETVKEAKQSKDKPAKSRTYSNGLIVEEIQMGKPNGKRASPGKKVSVNYVGNLKTTGEVFDSTSGSPFKFRLGIGQVIKGWDVGVEGMRVGDKRRLTVPPSMGYGSAGAAPKIPPNAWLVFDVELVDVA